MITIECYYWYTLWASKFIFSMQNGYGGASCCINIRRLSDAKKIGRCAYKQYFITFDKSGQKMCVEMAMMMENFQQKSKRATTPSCWGGPLKKCDAWLLALSIYNHVDFLFVTYYLFYEYIDIFWDFHANRLVSNKTLVNFVMPRN